MTRLLLLLALLISVALNSPSQRPGTLIDNFDGSKKLDYWKFSNGAEFPGASGMLSLASGHQGRGALLAYRFTCLDQAHCGRYVSAVWTAPHPLEVHPGTVLSLWVCLSPDVRLTVRVTDQTGQTLQFSANVPTLEHPTPGEWQPVIIAITGQAAAHWGGANSGQLQRRIVKVAILADSRYAHAAQGHIAFDDLQLFETSDATLGLEQRAALVAPPESTGDLRHRLGVNIHFLKDDPALDIARYAGFAFVRTDLLWAKLEQHGHYLFAPFDDLMHSLETRGMGALWVLDYGHPNHGGEWPKSRQDLAAYSRYVAAVVSHFRGHNARFEVWNEPNDKHFLRNPAAYPVLLRTALASVRRQDPGAAVGTGGTAGFDFPFLATMLQSGSAQQASAVAVHPYRDSGPETLLPDLLLLRALIQRAAGTSLPVWDTEWGYSSFSNQFPLLPRGGHAEIARKRQAVLVLRECLTAWILDLPVAVLYDLRDDGSNSFDREHNFGLLNPDNSDKPAMTALRVLTRLSRDHKYSGLIRDVPYGAHGMRFDAGEDVMFALWDDDPQIRLHIRFPRDDLLSVTDLFGAPILPNADELVLEEATGPVYVHLKRR